MSTIVGCPSCKTRLAIKHAARATIVCPTCNFNIVLDAVKAETAQSSKPVPTELPSSTPVLSPNPPPRPRTEQQGIDLSLFSKPKTNPVSPAVLPSSAPIREESITALAPDNGLSKDLPIPNLVPAQQDFNIESAAASAESTEISAADTQRNDPQSNTDFPFKSPSVTSVHSTILKRKKRQRLYFLVVNSLLALITLTIAGVLYWRVTNLTEAASKPAINPAETMDLALKQSSTPDFPTSPPSKEAGADSPRSLTAASTEAASVDTLDANPSERREIQPALSPPVFRFFSEKQVSEIWKITKPNLVSLKIDGPKGQVSAVGLIVDSRGWIVTSYQAVKDATKVEVTAATEPLSTPGDAQDPPLIDLVRGRVIEDPTNDLAILAINRRFVVSLAEPKFDDKDRLVEQLRLLAVAPPSTTEGYGVYEVHVEQRNGLEQLPLATKSKLELMGIGTPDLSWITLTGSPDWLPGTPLIDSSGKVQAMISLSRENNRGLAVSLVPLRSLLKQATGDIKPFKLNQGQAPNGEPVLLDSEHPAQQAAVALNAAADPCRDFGWLPQTEENFQQLVEFGKNYLKGHTLITDYETDYRDSAATQAAYQKLGDLLSQLSDEIETRVQLALLADKKSIAPLNQFAEQALKSSPQTLVPMYVQVVEGGLQLEQFFVQLVGSDISCLIPFDSGSRPLRPGTYWLLMVETGKSNQRKKYKLPPDRTLEAYSATQKTQFGPFGIQ